MAWRRWTRIAALAYLALIFVLGSIPMPAPPGPEVSDKTMHFIAFALLALLLVAAYVSVQGPPWNALLKQLGSCALLSSAAGAALELWQSLLPFRSAEWADWYADSGGAILGAAVAFAWFWLRS